MSEVFKQGDKRWAEVEIGESGLKMKNYGCLITAIAQALTEAGHGITPGKLVEEMNKINGFTPDGLLIWAKVSEIVPQFIFSTGGNLQLEEIVAFEQGLMGKSLHWIFRRDQNNIIDPLYGTTGAYPAGWKGTGRGWICTISKAPVVEAPVEVAPVVEVVPPVVEAPVEVAPVVPAGDPSVVVVEGDTLGDLTLKHYGEGVSKKLWGKNGVVAKVAAHNGIEDANLIHVGDVIKFPSL